MLNTPGKYQKVFARTLVWLTAEVILTLLGIDDLADYSEFIFERNAVVLQRRAITQRLENREVPVGIIQPISADQLNTDV
ncbi:MAG: hypothetical protein AAGF01_22790 [Cyanobacteria bacterium P01_G01_bin.38]